MDASRDASLGLQFMTHFGLTRHAGATALPMTVTDSADPLDNSEPQAPPAWFDEESSRSDRNHWQANRRGLRGSSVAVEVLHSVMSAIGTDRLVRCRQSSPDQIQVGDCRMVNRRGLLCQRPDIALS
jgi:hypothetical protein